jgi:uncharacterized protein (TIGR00304 family)
MSVSPLALGFGLTMSGLGTILLLLSFRSKLEKAETDFKASGVIFLGPIPIVLGGKSIWTIIGLAITVVALIFVAAVVSQPEILRMTGL